MSDSVILNSAALRALRKSRGMSKSKLAVWAEISPSYVTELENGTKTSPSRDVLFRLMDALNIDPADERALTLEWVDARERAAA